MAYFQSKTYALDFPDWEKRVFQHAKNVYTLLELSFSCVFLDGKIFLPQIS